jgi:two-component system, sensor histidine kinase PdtaS
MANLTDRIMALSALNREQADHLRQLASSWQLLADLSFSDLLMYVRLPHRDIFEICAQLRPLTSQTLNAQDMVGTQMSQPEQPIVERAFREGLVWSQPDPVLVDGIPVRMDAVPVRYKDEVIAVITKEGSPAISRRPGRLERVYLQAAEHVSRMICEGLFPFRHAPLGEWPRVGEGMFVLDGEGRVQWASPNALSSLHRLGVSTNVLGNQLDALGLGETPVRSALASQVLMDGELARGDTYVRLRVVPLIQEERTIAGLVLSRDVSELRQKERLISVKDATIREIHHRVKNNLQTIASLLRLQGRRVLSDEAKAALQESELRIGSIALVHETLSEGPVDIADFGAVARRIGNMVKDGLVPPDKQIEIKVTGGTGPLAADLATPLAVTLTELIQNAVEHAFPNQDAGTIGVELSRDQENIEAVVWDDGIGIEEHELDAGATLGLQIVRSLVVELGGEFTMVTDGGTRARLRVPVPEEDL